MNNKPLNGDERLDDVFSLDLITYWRVWLFRKSRNTMSNKILTNREKEVFELLILNKSTKDIAKELNISEKTIRNHISNVMQKLGVKGRTQAVIELIKLGELSL